MTTYYVATLARYVLVEAADEHDARLRGHAALQELLGRDGPMEIRTVRPATAEEIELLRWHHAMIRRESE